MDRGCQVIVRKVWPWTIVGDVCVNAPLNSRKISFCRYRKTKDSFRCKRLNLSPFPSLPISRGSQKPLPVVSQYTLLPIILIVVELILVLYMNEPFATERSTINNHQNKPKQAAEIIGKEYFPWLFRWCLCSKDTKSVHE